MNNWKIVIHKCEMGYKIEGNSPVGTHFGMETCDMARLAIYGTNANVAFYSHGLNLTTSLISRILSVARKNKININDRNFE